MKAFYVFLIVVSVLGLCSLACNDVNGLDYDAEATATAAPRQEMIRLATAEAPTG